MENQNHFCRNCGKAVNPNDKFCGSCGQTVLIQEESLEKEPINVSEKILGKIPAVFNFTKTNSDYLTDEEIEKNERKLARAGGLAQWLGWLRIIIPIPFYIIAINKGLFLDLPTVVWNLAEGFFLVVLGGRLKDRTPFLRKYIVILLILLTPISYIGILSGKSAYALNFLLIIYLVIALFGVNKLLKSEKYRKSLQEIDYKIGRFSWSVFGVGAFVLFILAVLFGETSPNF